MNKRNNVNRGYSRSQVHVAKVQLEKFIKRLVRTQEKEPKKQARWRQIKKIEDERMMRKNG